MLTRRSTLDARRSTLEALLPAIRRAMAETPVDLCPHNISAAYHRVLAAARPLGLEDQAVELYLEAFEKAEQGEIQMFSDHHRARHGRDTPHVAAEASVMRGYQKPT